MAEKFDVEFRRKVKGINPEVPEIVKRRIEETLASLPDRKKVPRHIYSTVAAALILLCIIGLGYRTIISSPRQSASKADMQLAAAGNSQTQDIQNNSFGMKAADSTENTGENATKSYPKTDTGSADRASQGTTGKGASAKVATALPQTIKATPNLTVSTNNGINVELKSASYDGQQIKVQFVKTGEDTGSDANTIKSMVKTDDKYDMDIIINSIPLKCSISLKDAPSTSNQNTGEFVITPESPLPDEFEMGILFKQLGDISGQWEIYAHIKKDAGN